MHALANPLVAGEFGLRFYVGVPLRTHDGINLGTLCVIDREPHSVAESQIAQLKARASIVMDQMELRLSARRAIADLSRMVDELSRIVDEKEAAPATRRPDGEGDRSLRDEQPATCVWPFEYAKPRNGKLGNRRTADAGLEPGCNDRAGASPYLPQRRRQQGLVARATSNASAQNFPVRCGQQRAMPLPSSVTRSSFRPHRSSRSD
jgi:hypothetical protein